MKEPQAVTAPDGPTQARLDINQLCQAWIAGNTDQVQDIVDQSRDVQTITVAAIDLACRMAAVAGFLMRPVRTPTQALEMLADQDRRRLEHHNDEGIRS